MTEETLKKANEIQKRIDSLKYERARLPKELISSIYNTYTERILKREYKLKILKGTFTSNFEISLTDEDLQALVKIREKKIEELQKELAELH